MVDEDSEDFKLRFNRRDPKRACFLLSSLLEGESDVHLANVL